MAVKVIGTGSSPNDGTGDNLRTAGGKINDNFTEIYDYFGDGSTLSNGRWDVTNAGINTISNVGIGTTNPIDAADTNNTKILNVGIVTANFYYGDGSNLTGIDAGQVGALTDIVNDTTPQLGGELDVNNNSITGTGNVNLSGIITAIDFNSTSDARLKTNVQVISEPLDKIVRINGVSFNWIENNKPSIGVIADNIQEVLPELVTDTNPKTVNYNGLIGLLIEVVKEQQTQIDSLNERLSRLE